LVFFGDHHDSSRIFAAPHLTPGTEHLRQGGGSTTAIPSAMWMRQPCSCTARWCGRHRETRFSRSVLPSVDPGHLAGAAVAIQDKAAHWSRIAA
jgi:hypothetical protein